MAKKISPLARRLQIEIDLLFADEAFDAAGEKALKAVRAAFPVGSVVRWEHGGHVRSGVVTGHTGFQYGSCGFRVRSPAGAEYGVDAGVVLLLLKKVHWDR